MPEVLLPPSNHDHARTAGSQVGERMYHEDGASLPERNGRYVFVFGSNLAGRHGAGAAKVAATHYGARYGIGVGPQGNAYAIPTKGMRLEVLDLETIERHVRAFITYARTRTDQVFLVTRVGCGLAGYKDADIAPMFADAPANCSFARQWASLLSNGS